MADPILDPEAVAGLLTESLRTIEWAAGLVPPAWTHQTPDNVPADSLDGRDERGASRDVRALHRTATARRSRVRWQWIEGDRVAI